MALLTNEEAFKLDLAHQIANELQEAVGTPKTGDYTFFLKADGDLAFTNSKITDPKAYALRHGWKFICFSHTNHRVELGHIEWFRQIKFFARQAIDEFKSEGVPVDSSYHLGFSISDAQFAINLWFNRFDRREVLNTAMLERLADVPSNTLRNFLTGHRHYIPPIHLVSLMRVLTRYGFEFAPAEFARQDK